jgi:hypothetical protein
VAIGSVHNLHARRRRMSGMDVVAVVLAIAMFAVLLLMIAGIDRI